MAELSPWLQSQGLLISTPSSEHRCDERGARAFPHTGYYCYAGRDVYCVIDAGPVGPDYQPGHAHCDTLSFELSLHGQRLIVDSGVMSYEAGEERHWVRSTAAHNSVRVDDAEQSEIWGVFRVARRARPGTVGFEGLAGEMRFQGSHDGYTRLPGRPVHHRNVLLSEKQRTIEVQDRVSGAGYHRVESFIHLHHQCAVTNKANDIVVERTGVVCRISPRTGCQFTMEEACTFPRFGERRKNTVLKISSQGQLPLKLGYTLSWNRDR